MNGVQAMLNAVYAQVGRIEGPAIQQQLSTYFNNIVLKPQHIACKSSVDASDGACYGAVSQSGLATYLSIQTKIYNDTYATTLNHVQKRLWILFKTLLA